MLETRQLHPTLAREVVDLRLWEQLADATIAEMRTLYGHCGVLVFRRQALSECVVPGITPASVCVPERRWRRRH
jgi:hypothetical protein